MPKYCLDTNVLIQAKNGPYGFDIAESFWELIDQKFDDTTIITPTLVYKELTDGNDELAEWIRARKGKECFIEPDKEAQDILSAIADYVNQNYPQHEAAEFLSKADPWVIAVAKVTNCVVVTQETLVGNESKKLKIPNICRKFGVKYIGTYQLLRELRANIRI
jgi:hypothetical protein